MFMKRFYILFSLFIISIGIYAQEYYWYKGKQIYFEQIAEQTADMPLLTKYLLPLESKSSDWREHVTTNRFLVKLKSASDYALLVQYANTYNVESVTACSLPLWYILSCSENTIYDALTLANLFFESASFAAAEPEFKNFLGHTCVNDSLFGRQWYLNNTGQNGTDYIGWDINYCDAHAITSGDAGVKIALIDVGVDSTHEDIPQPALRYDMLSMTNQDSLYWAYIPYGTAAAGIIAASTNNTTGIAGIAPYCSLMSISIPVDSRLTSILLADAIIYAVNHDADVINTPWGSLGCSEYIYDALEYAHTYGRNGRGCVVVLGAGNFGGPIMFPAETHEENVVVGAVSQCGTRAGQWACGYDRGWGSCYGNRLDVVAPGEIITTSKRDSMYTFDFEGTSASCAQVSAIAGLILSINPNLSGKEVGDIINSTARKVGPYSYDSIAPNGNWDFEMGYGLVDAYTAVQKAQLSNIEISGPTYLCDARTTYRVYGAPDSATYQWHLSNRVILNGIIGSKTNDTVVIGLEKFIPGINDSINWRGEDNYKAHIDPSVPSIPLPDSAMLSVTISKNGISYTKHKVVCGYGRGKPEFVCSDTSTYWQRYTSRTFTITNCYEAQDNNLRWTFSFIDPIWGNMPVWADFGRSTSFIPTFVGTYEVLVENQEIDCTPKTTTKNYIVVYDMPAKSMRKTATDIKEVQQNEMQDTSKILRDGQLFIIHEGKEYNANGMRIR